MSKHGTEGNKCHQSKSINTFFHADQSKKELKQIYGHIHDIVQN